jgi:hypothetical protein
MAQNVQDRRYGSPRDIQGLLNQAEEFESIHGDEPSFWERMRKQQDQMQGITPNPPDYTKPIGPPPVTPSFEKDQLSLASNEGSPWQDYNNNIMEEVSELATLSQKINILLNSPNTSETEKSQFRNILNGLHHRMNQLMGLDRNLQPARNNGLSI